MKDIPGFEGLYFITKSGKIFSAKNYRGTIWREIRTHVGSTGYYCARLYDNNYKQFSVKLHRLLAIAFIPNPLGLPEVNHKNGIKTDNRLSNLEWCSHAQNLGHAAKTGLMRKGERHGMAKLKDEQVKEIKKLLGHVPRKELSRRFNVGITAIHLIAEGRRWTHIN